MIACALLSAIPAVHAQVSVTDPWVRATVSQQKATGAFMKLTAAADTTLVEVHSPLAGVAEIHTMTMTDGRMQMRPVAQLPLPAGQTVELKPGGLHVMFFDLKAQVKEGDMAPISLVFERADGTRETLEVSAPIRPLGMKRPGH
ncbi:MAG: copper chaperone PCu(A)C [Azoarcus sp.]|jgi:copper(I)-binding protein|nr:copper chaperone PCu(A)C [Azoarcus sp.]